MAEQLKDNKPDIIAMTREQLKGITVNFSGHESALEEGLEENEKRDLYADAYNIKSNHSFDKIARYLIDVQGNYSIKEAQNMGEVAFGRATINGIFLFMEEINRLSNLYKEENRKEEKFDPHALI